VEVRQVEATGAARNTAALGDGLEEFVLARAMTDGAVELLNALRDPAQITEHLVERFRIDTALRRESIEIAGKPIELLEDLVPDIRARGDSDDIQERPDGAARRARVFLLDEVIQLTEQMFQSQEGTDTFVERMFEGNQC
jgi:hypothetical protein